MKVSKASVEYRPATGKKECGNCAMFHPSEHDQTGTCDLVGGLIYEDDVCDKWVRRDDTLGSANNPSKRENTQ